MANSERLTFVQWTVCVIAAIGFAFDIYELLLLPLIVGPALQELGGLTRGTPGFAHWFGLLFYVPAVCGGIFGLLGGYLTDRFGRRRVLTWSILLYAFSAFLCRVLDQPVDAACSCGRPRSSACAWNSSPRWPGWRNCSTNPNGAKKCWDTRKHFRRWAVCSWPS